MRSFDPATVAVAPRPWLTRQPGECAFPVDGDGASLRSCCNPCGRGDYCLPHQAALRGPSLPSVDRYARAILDWLDQRS